MYEAKATCKFWLRLYIYTSLMCFVLQAAQEEDSPSNSAKRVHRNVFNEAAFLQTQRTAARGNVSLFLMPLVDMLTEL